MEIRSSGLGQGIMIGANFGLGMGLGLAALPCAELLSLGISRGVPTEGFVGLQCVTLIAVGPTIVGTAAGATIGIIYDISKVIFNQCRRNPN